MASLSIGMRIALAIKPGLSVDCVTSVFEVSIEAAVYDTESDEPFLQA